jgi:hypothetical protein
LTGSLTASTNPRRNRRREIKLMRNSFTNTIEA